MNLLDGLLPAFWYGLAWVLWLPLFFVMFRRCAWPALAEDGRLNVWLGMIVVLVLLWSLKAGVKPGLDLHLTGVMVFTLVFGAPLAFVGLNLVLLGITLNGAAGWFSFALNSLLMVGLGVLLSHLIYRTVDRFFPNHFFVFIFCKAYFGAALVVLGVGGAYTLLYGLSGVYDWLYLLEDYLPYYLLLGFSEAWISGMVITLMLVYRQDWVMTFTDKQFFRHK